MTGQVVLVHGGAGAVGNAAIQLAAWSGATVLTTVSSDEKAALATAAGAHHVVNYRAQDAAAAIRALAPDGVDLIAEVSPAVNNELDVAVAGNGATIAVYANNGGDTFPVDIRRTFGLNLRYQFLLLYTLDPALLAAAAQDVTAAVAAGALRAGDKACLSAAPLPARGDRRGPRRGRAGRGRQGADRHRLTLVARHHSLLCTIGVMAYDEVLAGRIRDLIGPDPELTEKKMFGGLAFLIRGHMAISASGQGGVLVHCDPGRSGDLVATTAATVAVMQGREMPGWLRVGAGDVATDDDLSPWVEIGIAHARSLPPKQAGGRATR